MERDELTSLLNNPNGDFNSHAHVERDLIQFPNFWDIKNFNSHAHVERDQIVRIYRLHSMYFNSHAHVERDRYNLQ